MDPDQSYYPRVRLRLTVVFDEYGKRELTGVVPKKPTKNFKGVNDKAAPLEVSREPNTPRGVRRWLLLPRGDGFEASPGAASASDPRRFVLDGIVPSEAQVSRNGLRTADTFSCALRFIDLPVDPRVVRACGVEFFLGTISAEDHATEIETGVEWMLPEEYVDAAGTTRRTRRFQGFVDKWDDEWPKNGEPTVHLSARDNTQLLVDTEVPAKLTIASNQPLDKAIADYLAHFQNAAGLTVEYRGEDDPPRLETSLAKTAFRPELGPPPSKGGASAGGEKLAVWDYLTDVCSAVGHLVRVEDSTVIIQQAKNLLKADAPTRADDPFRGRDGGAAVRRWIYGRNVESMKFGRTFTRSAPTNIEVRCYSTRLKKVLVGRFPSTGNTVVDAKPSGVNASEKWKVIDVTGVESEATLRVIAQNYYEVIGRNELQISLKTRNLASFGGGNTDPDALDLVPGDSFELLVQRAAEDGDDAANTLTTVEAGLVTMDRGVEFMRSLGFGEAFSRAYAAAYTDAGFQTKYRCKTVNFHWQTGPGGGIGIDLEGVNYVEVRADRSESGGGGGGGGGGR